MHKLNQMKLKPGLKVYSAIQPTLAYVMAAVNYELTFTHICTMSTSFYTVTDLFK